MNAQRSTRIWSSLRGMRVSALWFGLSVLIVGAVIVALALSRPAVPAAHPSPAHAVWVNPNIPVQGAGSAYDGRHYGAIATAPAATQKYHVFDPATIGTGSVYDGQDYGGNGPTPVTVHQYPPFDPATIGTGSVYRGQ